MALRATAIHFSHLTGYTVCLLVNFNFPVVICFHCPNKFASAKLLKLIRQSLLEYLGCSLCCEFSGEL